MKSKLSVWLTAFLVTVCFVSCITINVTLPPAEASKQPVTTINKAKRTTVKQTEEQQTTLTFQSMEYSLVRILNGSSPNLSDNPEIDAISWTWNGAPDLLRTYIKFAEIASIPNNAKIQSAILTLYGLDSSTTISQGNSYYPGSPYYYSNNNATLLKRVLGDWNEKTITWSNKPATTDANEVALPASNTQWNFDLPNIDVTNLISDMVAQKANYGFCLQLLDESIYKSIGFYGSRSPNAAKHPKLVITYLIPK